MRAVERLEEGQWVDIDFLQLEKGVIFRMFEDDGSPVLDEGISIFLATSDLFYSNGVPTIKTEHIKGGLPCSGQM